MPRTNASSNWYMPLVSGVEVLKRSPQDIVSLPAGAILGNLPDPPPWLLPGLALWLDAAATSTVHTFEDQTIYKWDDRSGSGASAVQPAPPFRPSLMGTDSSPMRHQCVTFEDPP